MWISILLVLVSSAHANCSGTRVKSCSTLSSSNSSAKSNCMKSYTVNAAGKGIQCVWTTNTAGGGTCSTGASTCSLSSRAGEGEQLQNMLANTSVAPSSR